MAVVNRIASLRRRSGNITALRGASGMLAIAALLAAGWAILGFAAARVVGLVGLVSGAVFLVTKLGFLVSRERANRRRVRALATEQQALIERAEHAEAAVDSLAEANQALARTNEDLAARVARLAEQVDDDRARAEADAAGLRTDLDRAAAATKRAARDAKQAQELTREMGTVLREELTGALTSVALLEDVEVLSARTPILSIAIPGYNRPVELERCLQSIVDQIGPEEQGLVEVIVTDDASTDVRAAEVAYRFALEHDAVGFRQNLDNLGLERNLVECTRTCSGDHVWVFGNDDQLEPGGLAAVLDELSERAPDVLMVEKRRIDKYGAPRADKAGVSPATIAPGTRREFESMLDVARGTGIISSFGWITQIVVRREQWQRIDPQPFFDTTMYPQVAMMLLAFSSSKVTYLNTVVVVHRTQNIRQRLAEAAGRPEASYMAGGKERDARWFGVGYAAFLQRVIDRGPFEADDLEPLREALWTELSMLDWIEQNWHHGARNGVEFPADMLVDAERLFTSLGRPIPT